jgi:hypothetical protein
MKSALFYFIIIISSVYFSFSQVTYNDYGFKKNFQIKVNDHNGLEYKKAWLGGLNSCQFGTIDLDQDGIKDLIVFDRNGNRLLTFINDGIANTISYKISLEFEGKFPYLHDWVKLYDYNCDGKEDIFTYSTGGIAVYKNISNTTDGLKFKLITPLLNSLHGSFYTNIFVTSVDYPAFSDIDNDGDMDILTFFGLGSYVAYHKNLSKELYGVCDSLKFQLAEYCWGKFREDEGNNRITLNIICPYADKFNGARLPEKDEIKHTGSTLLAIDLDGDADKDLLLGDVDFPNLIALTNGGTLNNALMVSMDTVFPSYNNSIQLFAFPSASFIDVNNDNKNDLLVSPFDGNIAVAENKQSIWLYTNSGTNSNPVFNYQMSDFLQAEMIDFGTCAYPVFFDYDNDGLTDLFIGNYGYRDTSYYSGGFLITKYCSKIALFRNTGTSTAPQFSLITSDLANASSLNLLGLYPTFGDIDNDGKTEMIVGNSVGKLLLYKNNATVGNPPDFVLQQVNYQNIDVGDYSTPQLIDLDRDGLLDLVIGEKGYRKGNLNFYRNTGTTSNPVFTFITDSLGRVDVCNQATSNFGYSVPCFFEDNDGKYNLFVGSEEGYIHYYNNIENNLNGTFNLEDPHLLYIYEGIRTGVAVTDLDHDGYIDMIIGNYSGGLGYYKGTEPQPQSGIRKEKWSDLPEITLFPNPVKKEINLKIDAEYNIPVVETTIFNILGKNVRDHSLKNGDLKINVTDLPQGIYILRIKFYDERVNEMYSVTKKFSIIR